MVLEHLAPLADSEEALDRIAYLVRYHAKRSDPALLTTELKLLQDADILDHRGCMQIWLAVGGAVSEGRDPEQIAAEWDGQQRRQRRAQFRDMLHFDESKRRFDERLARETAFYNAVKAEIRGLYVSCRRCERCAWTENAEAMGKIGHVRRDADPWRRVPNG